MNILVIGGNRFFGRHLVNELLSEGHNVTVMNRGSDNSGFNKSVEFIKADRTSEEDLITATRDKNWDLVYDQVCYTASEAKAACRAFSGKTKKYIVTSSESVYDHGADQKEERFNAYSFSFKDEADRYKDYQGAKRQMESVFAREADFEIALVRPSLVVGTDDYTKRLHWHLERIRAGLPIYFPNIDIQSDFIRSDQAGTALKIIGLSNFTGAINCTTKGSISLRHLITLCEEATGKKAILASHHEGENHSPYGGEKTKTMNTEKLYELGFDAAPSIEWLSSLIQSL